jgi:putative glutamine amidotransferase
MSKDRPVIGLVSYGRNEKGQFYLPATYVDAVRQAGGLPVILPPGDREPQPWLDLVDGVVLTGGGDIDPELYGGLDHPTIYLVDAERDHSELALARLAVEEQVPTLAICRGIQVLNVALGGDLVEHVPDVYGEEVIHRLNPPGPADHSVRVAPDTQLAQIFGQTEAVVRSWHHQAVKRPGKGLRPAAWAPDGVIEAVEAENRAWVVGVQWHPELMVSTDRVQRQLFAAFVDAARRWRSEGRKT